MGATLYEKTGKTSSGNVDVELKHNNEHLGCGEVTLVSNRFLYLCVS
jgi:hypothetical protein